jgi:dihydrofolate reductase
VGAILVHEFMTLDGIIDAPVWTAEFGFDPAMAGPLAAVTGRSAGILLGRTTYQMFEPAWSTRTVEDDPGAPFFNETEKLVVGANEPAEEWANTTRLGAYDADAIRRLKQERDGVIYVSGSGQLVRGLIRDGLVDEVHLFVYPISLGEGERFWAEGEHNKLVLQAHDVYDNGVVHLSYGLA